MPSPAAPATPEAAAAAVAAPIDEEWTRARLLVVAAALAAILLDIVTETTRPPARPFSDVAYLPLRHLQAAQAALSAAGIEVPQDPTPTPSPKFSRVSCSNCGGQFGPGDHGYSHCESHAGKARLG